MHTKSEVQSEVGQYLSRVIKFDIPSQELSAALIQFGDQAGISVLIQSVISNQKSNDLQGVYSVQTALDEILAGTDLRYKISNHGVVVHSKVAGQQSSFTKNKKSVKKGFLAALIGIFSASGLQAEDGSTQEAKSNGSIEEMVITAGRREQNLQDVSASVVAIKPEDFTSKGLQDLEDVINYTPGIELTPNGRPGEGSIAARGIPQLGSSAVFGVYLDDTPLTGQTSYSNAGANFLDGLLLDIERIEVIKGPQGTLFGASSVGGMLRYISRQPSLDEVRGSFSADYNSVQSGGNGHTISGSISLPLIEDRLGLTVSGFTRDIAGYVDQVDGAGNILKEDYDSADVDGISADLLFQATENLDVRLKYLKQETMSDASSNVLLVSETDRSFFGGFKSTALPSPSEPVFEIYSATVNYDFDFATLTSSTSIAKNILEVELDLTASLAGFVDSTFGLAPGTTTNVSVIRDSSSEKFTQEIRLTSTGEGQLEWIAGLYYADEDTENVQSVPVTPTVPSPMGFAEFPSNYKEQAVFGSVTYYFTDNFDVQVGARYSENEIDLSTTIGGVLSVGVPFGPILQGEDGTDDSVTTYLVAARYRVSDDLSLYSRIATGYRPATPNLPLLGLTDAIVRSDESISYEIGAKGSAADDMLRFDTSLWYSTYDDFQTTLLAFGAGSSTNAENGMTAYGVDASFTYLPTDRLSFILNLGYANSTLDGEEPALNSGSGDKLPNVPKAKGSLQWSYGFDVSGDWTGSFDGGVRYVGDMSSAFDTPFAPLVNIESRVITDLSVNLTDGIYSATLYATNLFNEDDLSARNDSLGVSQGVFERPRTIGVSFSYNF